MILNGLGFSNRALYLTPRFFVNKPLEALLRPGVKAEHFNSSKLGKSLDAIYKYGAERLYAELAAIVCSQELIDTRFKSLDTTSISVTGEYDNDTDEHTIAITHGYSKDKRPDLKQLVHELLVSQDGGIPLMMKSWDGNSADNKIFQRRVKFLLEGHKHSKWEGYLIFDSKGYDKVNAPNLQLLNFITRIPASIKEEQSTIEHTSHIKASEWIILNEKYKYYPVDIEHYGIQQRWLVVQSKESEARAHTTVLREINREYESISKFKTSLLKQGYCCALDLSKALNKFSTKLKYHSLQDIKYEKIAEYEGKGRPKKGAEPIGHIFNCNFSFILNETIKEKTIFQKTCFIVASNANKAILSDAEVLIAYKNQNSTVENMGFRFLKDPFFFVSSLFLKKEQRIEALLMIMTLSLLVYSIAQRKLRLALKEKEEYVPNQIKRPSQKPTMRWVFQLLDGIEIVYVKMNGVVHRTISGLNEIKTKIISYFSKNVQFIYGLGEKKLC